MLISVIIPTYNHASGLPGLLQSIADQTYRDIEVIVVDDGSEDNPCAVVEVIKQNGFPFQITCVSQENKGAPAARNFGATLAKGEYLIFADADLVFDKSALEKLYSALCDNPTASYAYSSFKFGWKLFEGQSFNEENLKKGNYIHTSALIRRKDFIPFDEELKRFQDWDLWLTMLEQGRKGVFVNEVLFQARVMRAGISKWKPRFWYKIWPSFWQPKNYKAYLNAKEIILKKHGLC